MSKQSQLSDYEKDFYARNILVPEIGEEGQLALLGSRVLVVGAGGLGSPVLYYLATAGVGKIGIADGDRVEVSNLQRQILHGIGSVGKEKTASARESLMRIRPDLDLEIFPFRLDQMSLLFWFLVFYRNFYTKSYRNVVGMSLYGIKITQASRKVKRYTFRIRHSRRSTY